VSEFPGQESELRKTTYECIRRVFGTGRWPHHPGVKRLEEKRTRILELRRRGEDDASSQRILASLIHLLTIYEQRREHLVERLLLFKAESEAGLVGENFSSSLNL
jgi:hypothetical protein